MFPIIEDFVHKVVAGTRVNNGALKAIDISPCFLFNSLGGKSNLRYSKKSEIFTVMTTKKQQIDNNNIKTQHNISV